MVRPAHPSDELSLAVTRAMGDAIADWHPVSGGFSSAGLWVIETRSGARRFLKASTSEDTARFLRAEMVVYEQVNAPFMPGIEAWVDDGSRPFLIMEDLSGLHWPPPWSDDQIDAVLRTCDAIAATPPPTGLSEEAEGSLTQPYWPGIADDPDPVQELGIASPEWFEDAIPLLLQAEATAVLTGNALVHADIRSDNLCVGGTVKVVDWNWAFVGNPLLDVVAWLPSLRLEGGPPPWELLQDATGLVAKLAGFFLQHATKPRSPDVRADIREFQLAQGRVALEWAAHDLALAPIKD